MQEEGAENACSILRRRAINNCLARVLIKEGTNEADLHHECDAAFEDELVRFQGRVTEMEVDEAEAVDVILQLELAVILQSLVLLDLFLLF